MILKNENNILIFKKYKIKKFIKKDKKQLLYKNEILKIKNDFNNYIYLEKYLKDKKKKFLIIKYPEKYKINLIKIINNKLKNINIKFFKIFIITKKFHLLPFFIKIKSKKIILKKKILNIIYKNKKNKFFIYLKNKIKLKYLKKNNLKKYYIIVKNLLKLKQEKYSEVLKKKSYIIFTKKIIYDILIYKFIKNNKYLKKKFIKKIFKKININKIIKIYKKINYKSYNNCDLFSIIINKNENYN